MTKPIPRRNRSDIPPLYEQWLRSGLPGYLIYLETEHVKALWAEHGPAVIADYIEKFPGGRPPNFWRFGDGTHKPAGCPPDQFEYLLNHGLMSADEERRARAWRARAS